MVWMVGQNSLMLRTNCQRCGSTLTRMERLGRADPDGRLTPSFIDIDAVCYVCNNRFIQILRREAL